MNRQVAKWAAGVTVIIGLVVYIAQAAVRLNAIEEKAAKVPDVEKQVRIITIYIKLVDPENFDRATELAE